MEAFVSISQGPSKVAGQAYAKCAYCQSNRKYAKCDYFPVKHPDQLNREALRWFANLTKEERVKAVRLVKALSFRHRAMT